MSIEFPVVVKAAVGYATEAVGGVRRLDINPDYQHLKLQGVDFGEDFTTNLIEDPEYPGFAKLV